MVKRSDGTFALEYDRPKSIGYIASFYGNFAIILRAYAYMLLLGREGLRRVSENAVLNANYIQARLKSHYDLAYNRLCMHECVFSASRQTAKGVHALDVAKALIERGLHPPTIYFPLVVKEAMMIEPTETESREQMDELIDIMLEIADLAEHDPAQFPAMPRNTPVGRLDEVKAVKDMHFKA